MKLTIINGQSLAPNIEISAASSPLSENNFDCDIIYADLDAGEKAIYDDGMGVLVLDSMCDVDNTPYELDIQRMTSEVVNVGVDEITKSTLDYTTLSAGDQAKLDALNQLFIDKCW